MYAALFDNADRIRRLTGAEDRLAFCVMLLSSHMSQASLLSSGQALEGINSCKKAFHHPTDVKKTRAQHGEEACKDPEHRIVD